MDALELILQSNSSNSGVGFSPLTVEAICSASDKLQGYTTHPDGEGSIQSKTRSKVVN